MGGIYGCPITLMSLFKLRAPFAPAGDQPAAIESLVEGLSRGEKFQTLLGVTGSGKTFTMANVIAQIDRPTLVLAPNKTLAAQLCAEFRDFFPENAVEYFVSYYDYYQPEAYIARTDTYIDKEVDINKQIEKLRLSATRSVFSRRDVVVVASVSCIYGIGSPVDYGQMTVALAVGSEYDLYRLLRRLTDLQYGRNDPAPTHGNFRLRGDVLEIFPSYDDFAYRCEFFGDQLERILQIDTLTGEILAEQDSVEIYPARHYVAPAERIESAIGTIEVELTDQLARLRASGELLAAARLEQRTRFDIEMLREVGYCSGIENYSRHIAGTKPGDPPWVLLDYLPEDFLMIIDESHLALPQVGAMLGGDRSRKQNLVEYGFRLPSAFDNRPLSHDEFLTHINQAVFTSATPAKFEYQNSSRIVEQIVRPTGLVDPQVSVRPSGGQIDDLVEELNKRTRIGQRALVTTLTKRMAEELAEYLAELGMKVHYLHSEVDTLERVEILNDLRRGVYDVVVGINLLREGLDLPEVTLVAILDADKEGFLRSEGALIQTMGRAARHVDGQVIMYADYVTGSMRRAIDETDRRRQVQVAYNRQHGITAKSVHKQVRDVREMLNLESERSDQSVGRRTGKSDPIDIARLGPAEAARRASRLEEEMHIAADALNFERAAELRNEIAEIRAMLDHRRRAGLPAGTR